MAPALKPQIRGYRGTYRADGSRVSRHVLVAELALGKGLPEGTVVHHIDENKDNNANHNLVICQNESYHQLLHARARIIRAGGNPNIDKICGLCKQVKPRTQFSTNKASWTGRATYCRLCFYQYRRQVTRPRRRERERAHGCRPS